MSEKIVIKQANSSFLVRSGLLVLPIGLLTYVALDGGMDERGIVFTIAFALLGIAMLLWFSSKKIIIDNENLSYQRLFERRRTVVIGKIREMERRFSWVPTAKTLAADSTLRLKIENEDPLIIPIEDLNEKDIQSLINLIKERNSNVVLNKLAQRTSERKLTQYQLLTSNWQSLIVAVVIFIFIVVILGLAQRLL